MALADSESVAYGNIKVEPQLQFPDSPQGEYVKDPSISSLNKQNSIFSLTFDEIQTKSGRSFGSMNMDEFLSNLWSVDDNNNNQVSSQLSENVPASNSGEMQPNFAPQGPFSIPDPLCKKTVDEVWFDIQKEQPQPQQLNNIYDPGLAQCQPQSQQTLGEMTLEDFLIKAGVVRKGPSKQENIATLPQKENTYGDINYGMGNLMGSGLSGTQGVENNFSGNNYAMYPMYSQCQGYVGESSNVVQNEKPQILQELEALITNKKIIDGPPEVVVERRQRRMIKNRESAARSRARKQAYTLELELELNQLKDENAKLRLAVEETERKRKKEVMKRKKMAIKQKKADKSRTLRRTASSTW